MKKLASCICSGAVLLSICDASYALTTSQANATLRFNLSNPGARSLGFGGAFIGLADDATAAYANPAGLTNLFAPEISLEYRHSEFTTTFVDRGRFFGTPSGEGIDTIDGIEYADADSSTDSLSFLSLANTWNNWSVGVYRHQAANFETFYRSQGPILGDLPTPRRRLPREIDVDLEVVNWGASVAYRLTENFSLGVGLSYYDFDFYSTNKRFPVSSATAPPDYTVEPRFTEFQTGSDNDTGINVGALWKINSQFSLGFSYRQGPEFDYDYQVVATNPAEDRGIAGTTNFTLPDSIGVGLSYKPTEALTINFDYVRVTYSDISDGIILRATGESTDLVQIDDGDEFRLGAEYVFLTGDSTPIALRAGVWRAPSTVLEYVGPVVEPDPENPDFGDLVLSSLAVYSRPNNEETHFSIGGGIVFERFQLDIAADFADSEDTLSVAGIFFFR